MNTIKNNKISFGVTAKERNNIQKACETLKVKISPTQRIEIPVDTAQIGEKFHISTIPTADGIKLETKLTKGSKDTYAVQTMKLKDLKELNKVVNDKNFNSKMEVVFDQLKAVLRKMESNHE